jgi:hypothetical protein
MADIAGTPQVGFAGGFFSGRVESEFRESAQATYYQLVSVDSGPTGVGATIISSQITQALGYQIAASLTWFSTVTPAVTGNGNTPTAACVLPQTSRPYPFNGLQVVVANYGVNPINCYPHPNDANNSINSLAANTPVVLGPNTITPFQCIVPGTWNAVDIGGGFMGSIETIVSQGNITGGGSSQGTATPVTQAISNVSTSAADPAGVTLPTAKAGANIAIANNSGATIRVYGAGADTINGGSGATGTTQATALITLYICATNGAWLTK